MPIGGILLNTLPVVAFLALLVLMDSFKLVAGRAVLRSLLVGALAAFVALQLNTWIPRRSRHDGDGGRSCCRTSTISGGAQRAPSAASR